jgi:hypothetical protein
MSNQLKVFSGFLLAWYGIARWLMLGAGNETSIAWLTNSFGSIVALFSIVYLIYSLITITPQKQSLFILSSIIMFLINLDFLVIMTKEFIEIPSQINFGYFMLDIAILCYYSLILKLCFITKFNKNVTSDINVSCV